MFVHLLSNKILHVIDFYFCYSDDVLCNGNTSWQPSAGGIIPPKAVHAGNTANGEPLYVGRVAHEGSIVVGKVQGSHQVVSERSFLFISSFIYFCFLSHLAMQFTKVSLYSVWGYVK